MKYLEFNDKLSAANCFAVEEYIINNGDFTDDYFLLWRTRPTLMIGRFQNTIEEINTKFVEDNKLEIVRRNSGGGTIYTDENCWQFSFITWKNSGEIKNFQDFTKPVISALMLLGIDAEFAGRNDLLLNGKKFSGNAQFGTKDRFLHHGSILFDANLENLIRALTVADEKIISKGIKSIKERVINIKEYLKNPNISSIEFSRQLIELLKKDMQTIHLSEKDLKNIEKIEREKFLSWEWNFGKSPEFNIRKTKRFDGGKIDIQLNVKNGIITNCKIFGDFFYTGDISKIENLLTGTPYRKSDIYNKLKNIEERYIFYSINVDDLFSCFF